MAPLAMPQKRVEVGAGRVRNGLYSLVVNPNPIGVDVPGARGIVAGIEISHLRRVPLRFRQLPPRPLILLVVRVELAVTDGEAVVAELQ